MTKDELEKEATLCVQAYIIGAELREKCIKELEKRIRVLLSCKNCPDNKGGFICQKEYEDKCLAQKIQYIEELKEENAELKKQQFSLRNERNTFLAQNEQYEKDLIDFNENLTKAKEIIKGLLNVFVNDIAEEDLDVGQIDFREKVYKFLKEVEE